MRNKLDRTFSFLVIFMLFAGLPNGLFANAGHNFFLVPAPIFPASSLTKTQGDNQTRPAGYGFDPIAVRVDPAAAGLTVTWTVVPLAGAGATFSGAVLVASSTTNASGVATAPALTANSTKGPYSLTASAPGAGTVTFTFANSGEGGYPEFDLQVSQSDSPHTVSVGSLLTYNITVSIVPSAMGGNASVDTRFNFPTGVPIIFNSASGPFGVVATPDPYGVSFSGGVIQTSGINPGVAILTVVVTPQSAGMLTSAGRDVVVDPGNIYREANELDNTAQTVQTSVAASSVMVTGKVLSPDGRGARNVTVSMTDAQNNVRVATTSSFGLFSFDNVMPGSSYTFKVQSRSFRYNPQTVVIFDATTLPDFLGLE